MIMNEKYLFKLKGARYARREGRKQDGFLPVTVAGPWARIGLQASMVYTVMINQCGGKVPTVPGQDSQQHHYAGLSLLSRTLTLGHARKGRTVLMS